MPDEKDKKQSEDEKDPIQADGSCHNCALEQQLTEKGYPLKDSRNVVKNNLPIILFYGGNDIQSAYLPTSKKYAK
ncbi:MAG: hypothetical protein EOP51_15185 [Sphingobacteriales bacterium]|nr:MAG: hypothetical protein EOP51_15185 [Sphingobacteriales bacterium]